jgi:hypothetical protein
MATKAEKFRARQQRKANPAKPKARPKPRRDQPIDTSRPGVSATDRKAGSSSTAERNRSKRAAGKAGARLEDSASGRPSRKSTRKSANRTKRTTNLQRRQTRRVASPKARAKRR